MDGLRERRRSRHPQRSSGDAVKTKIRNDCLLVKRIHVVTVFVIFLISLSCITLLAVLLLTSTPHTFEHARIEGFSGSIDRVRTEGKCNCDSYPGQHAPNVVADYDVVVTLYAYDRPRALLVLLEDIAREADLSGLHVVVHVIDDNSMSCTFGSSPINVFDVRDEDTDVLARDLMDVSTSFNSSEDFRSRASCAARIRFRLVEEFVRARNWRLFVSQYRHGRRRYWHLVRIAMALLKDLSAKYYIFLPDDDRLATGFFSKAISAWESITDERKLTLMLHIEETRDSVPVWTNVKPRPYGGELYRIGWVESGNFLCDDRLLNFLNWSFPRVPIDRWINNPSVSSGVGSTLSELIHSSGLRMYRTRESLVAHIGVTLSKMNAAFRKKHAPALLTKYFADGDDAYGRHLREAATVSASMASLWLRETSLHAAVDSLAPQVDHLYIFLNDYDVVPSFLRQPFITVARSQDSGDKGDVGKFYWCNDLDTEFQITVDDDIVYPENYVSKLLQFWHSFQPPVVVGVHGIRVKQKDLQPADGKRGKGYYGSREVWMATEDVPEAVNVHILGTGTILYRPSDFGEIDVEQIFPQKNMADIWFGGLAKTLKVPMMVIPHRTGWIQEVRGTFEDSIYVKSTRRRSSDRQQTKVAQGFAPWVLHTPLLANRG